MHFLTRQRLHLSRFHPLMKILLSLYIASVAAAMWVAVLKYTDRGIWSTEGVVELVHGAESAEADPFGNPLAVKEGMSRRQIVDIVHPHLFTVPLVIFVLGHLLHLTRIPDALKLGINVVAFVSMLATFLLPFAVRTQPGFAPVLVVCGTAMLVSFALLLVIPFYEMWWGEPGKGFDALPRHGP